MAGSIEVAGSVEGEQRRYMPVPIPSLVLGKDFSEDGSGIEHLRDAGVECGTGVPLGMSGDSGRAIPLSFVFWEVAVMLG